MNWKTSIPIGAGIFLAAVAASVVGSAIFLTDKGEELVHLYGDYKAAQGVTNPGDNSGQMELMGHWRGMSLAALGGPAAAKLGVRELERGVVVAAGVPGQGAQAGDVITGVDNQPIKDLTELYNTTRRLNPATPTVLEVRRRGQTVALVVPPVTPARANFGGNREAENAWGAGVPAAWPKKNFYCPHDGTVLPRGSVQSPFLCPRCKGPLHLYPPSLR